MLLALRCRGAASSADGDGGEKVLGKVARLDMQQIRSIEGPD